MPRLIHTVDGTALRDYALDGESMRIGRNADNDIALDDDAVSGHHVEITLRSSEYMDGHKEAWVKDLGSTNGTFVNGRPVREYLLKHDDVLRVGTSQFKYVDDTIAAVQRTRVLIDD